jgi:hypothetical protein
VLADCNITPAELAGDYPDPLLRERVLHPQELIRQLLAEAAMDLCERGARDRALLQPTRVDPALDRYMRRGFKLKIALPGVIAVVTFERALDIDRVRVVPLDQVTVVAVHCAHEFRKRAHEARGERSPKPCGSCGQFHGQIGQHTAVSRVATEEKRLHQGDALAAIDGRLYVRFHVRIQ